MEPTAPKIELKRISHQERLSEETHCYSADLWVDGEKWGEVSNHGHGGPDNFHGVKGRGWADIKALDERIAKTMPAHEYEGMTLDESLEIICGELINDYLREKDFKRAMNGALLFTKAGQPGLFEIKRKGRPMDQLVAAFRKANPTATLLADLPVDEAKAIYFAS